MLLLTVALAACAVSAARAAPSGLSITFCDTPGVVVTGSKASLATEDCSWAPAAFWPAPSAAPTTTPQPTPRPTYSFAFASNANDRCTA